MLTHEAVECPTNNAPLQDAPPDEPANDDDDADEDDEDHPSGFPIPRKHIDYPQNKAKQEGEEDIEEPAKSAQKKKDRGSTKCCCGDPVGIL